MPDRKISKEERDFTIWLNEAMQLGIVLSYREQPVTFLLSERIPGVGRKLVKRKSGNYIKEYHKALLQEHVYTPDFEVCFNLAKISCFPHKLRIPQDGSLLVDTKGGFSRSSDRFSINQKWVMEKYGVFVEKVVPSEFFKTTWVPRSIATYMKKGEETRYAAYREAPYLEEAMAYLESPLRAVPLEDPPPVLVNPPPKGYNVDNLALF